MIFKNVPLVKYHLPISPIGVSTKQISVCRHRFHFLRDIIDNELPFPDPKDIVPAPLTRKSTLHFGYFPFRSLFFSDILYAFADTDASTGAIKLTDSFADESVGRYLYFGIQLIFCESILLETLSWRLGVCRWQQPLWLSQTIVPLEIETAEP